MFHGFWKFLGWFIAIAVGAGATIWVYKKQSYKAVTYQVVSMTPLAREARGFSDLKVLRGDKVIAEPFLITIRLSNAGDVHIPSSDFAEALELRPVWGANRWKDFGAGIIMLPLKSPIETGGSWHVADARVAETVPPGIRAQLAIRSDMVQIQPLLLNAGDQIVVELLLSGNPSAIQVRGRIAGVKEITEEKVRPRSRRLFAIITVAIGVLLGALVLAMLVWFEARVVQQTPKRVLRMLGLLISMLMGMFGALLSELLR